MWRSKKFIIIAVLAVVILSGSISGAVLAQTENGDQPKDQRGALLERVCAIYERNTGLAIDAQELQKAFDQARKEMQEEALGNFLQRLVDEGRITQEQADQYKAWIKAKPDIDIPVAPGRPGLGMPQTFGGHGGFPSRGERQPPE